MKVARSGMSGIILLDDRVFVDEFTVDRAPERVGSADFAGLAVWADGNKLSWSLVVFSPRPPSLAGVFVVSFPFLTFDDLGSIE